MHDFLRFDSVWTSDSRDLVGFVIVVLSVSCVHHPHSVYVTHK